MFWRMQPYGHTAVIVFFVLSGFVIAWATETRERTVEEYTLSRMARLYSVVLPAVITTAVLDHVAMAIDPSLYAPESITRMDQRPLYVFFGYVLSLVFLGQNWTLEMFPGSNIAFWSLDYEAWYYILFGLAMFLEGRRRIVALVGAALLAGPRILLLLPLWLMGWSAWRWRALLPKQLGVLVALGAVTAFIWTQALGGWLLWGGSSAADPVSRRNDVRALSAASAAVELLRHHHPRPAGPPNAQTTGIRAHPRSGDFGLACDRAAERPVKTGLTLGPRSAAQEAPPPGLALRNGPAAENQRSTHARRLPQKFECRRRYLPARRRRAGESRPAMGSR